MLQRKCVEMVIFSTCSRSSCLVHVAGLFGNISSTSVKLSNAWKNRAKTYITSTNNYLQSLIEFFNADLGIVNLICETNRSFF